MRRKFRSYFLFLILLIFTSSFVLPTTTLAAVDKTKPTITGASNKTIYVGSSFNPKSGVTAKDNVDGNLTSKIKISGSVNTKKVGTYQLTYTVSDKAKNKTTVKRTITVKKDTVKPTISGASNKTIYVGSSFNPKSGVTAKDNVDGNLTSKIKISGSVNTKKVGTYQLTYTVSDKAKNKTTVKRTITVKKDTVKPTISGASNKTIYVGSSFNPKSGVTAKDNVDGNLTSKIKISGSVNTKKVGTYQLTYTVSDKAKNKTTVKRTITVKKDTVKPTISGASNKTIYVGSSFNPKSGVTAKDNVDGNLTSKIKISGSVNTKKVGTYQLTYTVSDKAKNKTTVKRTITVKKDTVKPTISGASNKTIYVGSSFNPKSGVTAKDNVDGNLTSKIKISGSVNTKKVGTYQLTYTVSDKAKNKTTVKRTITVKKDTVKPTISGASNKTIYVGSSFNPKSGVTAKDNVDGNLTSKIKISGSVNTKKVGTYQLTYTVSDKAKNKTTVKRTITVKKDTVKPTISGASNKTIYVGSSFNPKSGVTAKDNVDGNLTSKIKISGSVNTKKVGTYQLTYTVSDKAKNKTTVKRTITVKKDTVKPTISGASNKTIYVGSSFNPKSGVTAKDNVDGNLTSKIKISGSVNTKKVGTYQLTYTVSDKAKNKTTVKRTITVKKDTVKPTISGASNKTIYVGSSFNPKSGVTAKDNVDGNLTSKIKISGSVNTKKVGTYQLTYTVSDKAKNKTTVKRTITVKKDTVKPTISGASNKTIYVGSSFNPKSGVTAKDNVDGNLTSKIKISGSVNTKKVGTYQLTYTVSDKAKNKTTVKRTITVKKDTVKPTISGASNKTIYVGSSFNPKSGVTAKDNVDGNLTSKIKISGSVNTKKVGTYQLTYTVSDKAKNKTTVKRTITVKKDTVKPTISGASNKTIYVGSSFNPKSGVTAKDNVDGNLTSKIKISGSVNTKKVGTYQLTYTVSDKAKNKTTVKRTITVKKDTVKPTISGASNKTIYVGSSFNPKSGVTAKDNVDGNLTSKIKISGSVNTKKVGTYQLTYTVSDKAKNKTTVKRTITVKKDTVKPTISGASNKTIYVGSSFNPKSGVTAKDNVDGNLTSKIKISGSVNTKKVGTYQLTYTVSDKAKNKTTVKRTITVKKDSVKPTISGASNKTIYVGSSFNPKSGVTAKDNVDGNLTSKIKISGSVNTKKVGTYQLTYTVSDIAKNKTTVKRTITVKKDTIKPIISGATNKNINIGTSFNQLAGVTAKDNLDGNITKSIKISGAVNVNKAGTYKLIYSVSDKAGNKATVTRIVTVIDHIKPILSGVTDVTINFGDKFNPIEGISATDNNDGDLTKEIQVSGAVNVNKAGTYKLTYSVSDKARNKATVTRIVTVIDYIKPVLSGVTDVTINFGDTFDPLEGISATDNNDGDLTKEIQVSGAVNVNKAGTYELMYTVTDNAGNKDTKKRIVAVIDHIPPTITGVGNTTVGLYTDFNILEGVTALDNNDGDLTKYIKTNGTVDTSKEGSHVISYTVTDAAGNTTEIKRTITVKKIPVTSVSIEAPDSIKTGKLVQLNASISPSNATEQKITWTSSNEEIASIDENGILTTYTEGTITITATVDGISGSKTITISDRPNLYVYRSGSSSINGVITSFSISIINKESDETVYIDSLKVYEDNSIFSTYSSQTLQNSGISTILNPKESWGISIRYKYGGVWSGRSEAVVTVKTQNGKYYDYRVSL
ncbi:immunoglobulin-like domain-containing protein [Bacillus andreraoultii]|uniref:immunoglobulin-like domain-containing protein n=1 Tax=Bacillus andreraoultii TaxID=1499685 RepID=UPI00067E786A|nr:immunoglobulin-like domain-containing protein [Bacillus andreraoultii]